MKRIILLMLLVFSCENMPIIDEAEAQPLPLVIQGKGQSGKLTEEQVQSMIDFSIEERIKTMYGYDAQEPWGHELYNIYYSRRETTPSEPFNIKYVEEIGARDYASKISGNGGFTELWLDGNGGNDNNNATLTTEGYGAYSKYWQTQNFLMLNQSLGIYSLPDLKVFDNDTDAINYFESQNWNKSKTLYIGSDGIVRATKPATSSRVEIEQMMKEVELNKIRRLKEKYEYIEAIKQ